MLDEDLTEFNLTWHIHLDFTFVSFSFSNLSVQQKRCHFGHVHELTSHFYLLAKNNDVLKSLITRLNTSVMPLGNIYNIMFTFSEFCIFKAHPNFIKN